MARKLTDLTELTSPADSDELYVVPTSGDSRKLKYSSLRGALYGDLSAATASLSAAASAIAGFDLSAIDESMGITIVDTCIYDTSLDDDGGAWRYRCRHTSWENEQIPAGDWLGSYASLAAAVADGGTASDYYYDTGSSTFEEIDIGEATSTEIFRGSKAKFPAVARITAEAGRVIIWDMDDPSVPMWMVFEPNWATAGAFWLSGRDASCVSCRNGTLLIGSDSDTWGALRVVEFVSDRLSRRSAAGLYGYDTIAERSTSKALATLSTAASARLVNAVVNDVAITTLPDAPIDPATGLPVPTIAVATDGGVSVIKDDGTVADSALTTGQTAPMFDAQGGLWYVRNASTHNLSFATKADYEAGDGFGDVLARSTAGGGYDFDMLTRGTGGNAMLADSFALGGTSGVTDAVAGLWVHRPNYADQTKGMSALITSDYNTGWMVGDIKGAFLADTDDADLVAATAFSDDGTATTNWTLGTGWAHDAGNTEFDHTPGNTATLTLAVSGLTSGTHYAVPVTIANRTAGSVTAAIGGASKSGLTSTGYVYFTATATTATLTITPTTDFDGSIGGASVGVADEDRSVNNNGLIVNGTVTKTAVATGADLVAYSGFSASDYFSQPYNSDLDFGTGDFCVMGWLKNSAQGNPDVIMGRYEPTASTAPDWALKYDTAEYLAFAINDSSILSSGAAYNDGIWHFVCVTRKSGVVYLYVDGVLKSSVADTTDLDNASAVLGVGARPLSTPDQAFGGSLALWRISATAPTAEQIAQIYADEKPLFQENAACTLYGASDAVTALAHDPITGLLHVGTSAGRSDFQGLRRVANTTTAITTAISAVDGLVSEQ